MAFNSMTYPFSYSFDSVYPKSRTMKNLIYFYLVLSIVSPFADAKKQDQKSNENLEYKDEHWLSAINKTKEDWKAAQEDYISRMNQYYQAAYYLNYYDEQVKTLEANIKDLQSEVEASTAKKKTEGLNENTIRALDEKIHNDNLTLLRLNKSLENAKEPRDRAAAQIKVFDPESSRQDLDQAAKTAYNNISINDSKWTHRAEVIEKETADGKVSDKKLKKLNELAQDQAKAAFHGEVGLAVTPKITQENKKLVAEKKQAEQKPVEQVSAAAVETKVAEPKKVEEAPTSKDVVKTTYAPVSEDQTQKAATAKTLVPETVRAPSSDCDTAQAEIVRTLLSKGNNPKAFSDMVYLAQLKMAYRIAAQKPPASTIESLVKQQGLQASAKASYADDQTNFKKDLTALYEKYGEGADLGKQSLLGEKEANYTKMRLNNDSASAVILYLSKNEQNSSVPFTEQDAAAVWAQQKLAKQYAPGTANYGLLNFSTRVCQMFKDGSCSNPVSKSILDPAKVESDYQARSQKLEASIQQAGAQILKEHPDCFSKEGCEKEGFKLGSIDIEAIKSKIAQLVGKGSLDGNGSKVEVDASLTKAQSGDLTIYLKSPSPSQ